MNASKRKPAVRPVLGFCFCWFVFHSSGAPDKLPNIALFKRQPSDRFLVDLDEMTSGHPFKGMDSAQPHAGAHVHFDNSTNRWPKGGTEPHNYPAVYAVADGFISRVDFRFGQKDGNHRYGLDLAFASDRSGRSHHFCYSIEPMIPEPAEGFYRKFLLVHKGQKVRKGDVLAYLYTPPGVKDAHIHFHLMLDGRNGFLAPEIFRADLVRQFHSKWGGFGRDGGTLMPPCMGYRLNSAENPFAELQRHRPLFTACPIDLEHFCYFVPMGMVAGGHVTPIDHAYFYPKNSRANEEVNVHAPGDGTIVRISFEDQTKNVLGPHSFANAVVIEFPGGIKVTYLLMTRLSARILGEVGGKLPVQSNKRIKVEAGEVIGRVGGRSLDFGVTDDNVTLTGFVNPRSYEAESWKIHTVDPLLYFDEKTKSQILSKNLRPFEPRGGKIDYDIDGKLVGNWFKSGSGGYGGKVRRPGEYWKGHLAFVYHHIDPRFVRVSIGNYNGQATQFNVKGNAPDPAAVSAATGLVKWELVPWTYYNSRTGKDWDRTKWEDNLTARNHDMNVMGTVLVQMIGDRTIRFEAFPGRKASQVAGFDDRAIMYER